MSEAIGMMLLGVILGFASGWLVAILSSVSICKETIRQMITLPVVVQVWKQPDDDDDDSESWKRGGYEEEDEE